MNVLRWLHLQLFGPAPLKDPEAHARLTIYSTERRRVRRTPKEATHGR